MRTTERLDQILIRMGHATPAQVQAAVERQKSHGGRFGSNLVELGIVTEEQLFEALVEQFRVPTIQVSEATVPRELVDRMPPGSLARSLVVPVGWDDEQKVLRVAAPNPSDRETIAEVGSAFGARKVHVSIAPESVLHDLAVRLGQADGRDERVRLVALPEVFEPEADGTDAATDASADAVAHRGNLLLVTGATARKSFLPPVLEPEGVTVLAASSVEEAREALERGPVHRVLVDAGMERSFRGWVESGAIRDPGGDVAILSSVGEALLDNPLPYADTMRSLRAAVETIADLRCAEHNVVPPYALMARDLELLADRVGLPRVAADGLVLGVHLLLPAPPGWSSDPFLSFGASLELVARLRFPWPVDAVLGICQGLYVGRVDPSTLEQPLDAVARAAQILALVWFRHSLFLPESEADATPELRTALRERAGRLATLDVVEAYVDEIADQGADDAPGGPG